MTSETNSYEVERLRYEHSLIEIIDFLRYRVREPGCAEFISRIYSLFRGIDRGEDAPVLRPIPRSGVKGGRRPTPEETIRAQGHACIAWEALVLQVARSSKPPNISRSISRASKGS